MIFIDKQGNYPKYLGDLREAYPEWTFKNAIPNGWKLVQETPPPYTEGLEMLIEEFPEEINGTFVQKWSIVSMPATATQVDVPETAYKRFSTDPTIADMVN